MLRVSPENTAPGVWVELGGASYRPPLSQAHLEAASAPAAGALASSRGVLAAAGSSFVSGAASKGRAEEPFSAVPGPEQGGDELNAVRQKLENWLQEEPVDVDTTTSALIPLNNQTDAAAGRQNSNEATRPNILSNP